MLLQWDLFIKGIQMVVSGIEFIEGYLVWVRSLKESNAVNYSIIFDIINCWNQSDIYYLGFLVYQSV